MFGDRCYIELQNHHLDEDQQKVRTLRNIPIVGTNNVHFQGALRLAAHDILVAMKENVKVKVSRSVVGTALRVRR
jgi:DNA polymerase III alpha subunit